MLRLKEEESNRIVQLELSAVKLERERISDMERQLQDKTVELDYLKTALKAKSEEEFEQYKLKEIRLHDAEKRALQEKRMDIEGIYTIYTIYIYTTYIFRKRLQNKS